MTNYFLEKGIKQSPQLQQYLHELIQRSQIMTNYFLGKGRKTEPAVTSVAPGMDPGEPNYECFDLEKGIISFEKGKKNSDLSSSAAPKVEPGEPRRCSTPYYHPRWDCFD
jgi:hypothetical protein